MHYPIAIEPGNQSTAWGVVVPHPKKDLGQGLVKAIRRQVGI